MHRVRGFALGLVVVLAAGPVTGDQEIVCSEYCGVCFQVLRGAATTYVVDGREGRYEHGAWGESNQRSGMPGAGGKRAFWICGWLYPNSNPVVDVTPDAPKPGEALACRIVVKSDRLGGELVDDYEYAWGTWAKSEGAKTEEEKFVKADVPQGPTLAAGVTKDGERWVCEVKPRNADGTVDVHASMHDEVEIGKARPGDSRKNDKWGWTYGQWRHCRGYLKFDVSGLAGKRIKSARLRLFCDVAMPPWTTVALGSSNDWKEKEITWVNQPVKFPFDGEPIGSVTMDYGPPPTEDNPATDPGWMGSTPPPGLKTNVAPAWREIDVTEYVRKAVADGQKEISICLAGEKSVRSYARAPIFNENRLEKDKDRGDMRPRLVVETE